MKAPREDGTVQTFVFRDVLDPREGLIKRLASYPMEVK